MQAVSFASHFESIFLSKGPQKIGAELGLQIMWSLFLSFFLSLLLALSLSLTHTHSLFHPQTLLSTLSHTHIHTHTLSLSFFSTHSLVLIVSLSLFLSLSLSLSLYLNKLPGRLAISAAVSVFTICTPACDIMGAVNDVFGRK